MLKLPLYILDIDDTDDKTMVFAVGLVDQPAIERNYMAFAKQNNFKVIDEEKQLLAGFLMVADQPIYRRDDDGKEYYVAFPAKSIEKIVNKFTKSGTPLSFNTDHNDNAPVKTAHLVSHFLINKAMGINTPEGHTEAPDGSWFGVVHVDDKAEWDNVKTRKGFSVEGYFNDIKLLDAEQSTFENLKNKLLKMEFKAIEKLIGKEAADKLTKFFNGEPLPPTPPAPPTELEGVKLADGSGMLKGNLMQGESLTMVAADGTESPCPDGVYMLEGGKSVTVTEGKVSAVTESAPEEAMSEEKVLEAIQSALAKQSEALTSEFAKQVKAITEKHEADLKTANEKFATFASIVEQIAGVTSPLPAPAEDPKGKAAEARRKNFAALADNIAKLNK